MKRLKIALVAPIEESVPPVRYGGTEFVVYTLAEELHRQGHDVTLFASGDSRVSCKLVPVVPRAIGSNKSKRLREALTYQTLAKLPQYINGQGFDIIHNHLTNGWQTLLFKALFTVPIVTTTHFMLEGECEQIMYSQFKDAPYISISASQRTPLPDLNYVATIHHGLNLEPFHFQPNPDTYLAFLGRFSPDKGPVDAIEVAKRSGCKLLMAGKINDFEREYYETAVKPLIDNRQIVNIGEVNLPGKVELLRNAAALLSPVHLHESFGLVNIEAMAVGTPVIATDRGSLPEIVRHGKTGFICSSIDKMVEAVQKISTIDRAACRRHVEQNFTAEHMANQYVAIYRRLLQKPTQISRSLSLAQLQTRAGQARRKPATALAR